MDELLRRVVADLVAAKTGHAPAMFARLRAEMAPRRS
jgi:hypothetical protein